MRLQNCFFLSQNMLDNAKLKVQTSLQATVLAWFHAATLTGHFGSCGTILVLCGLNKWTRLRHTQQIALHVENSGWKKHEKEARLTVLLSALLLLFSSFSWSVKHWQTDSLDSICWVEVCALGRGGGERQMKKQKFFVCVTISADAHFNVFHVHEPVHAASSTKAPEVTT